MEEQIKNTIAYMDGLRKIVDIKKNINPFYQDFKALVLKRMKELDDICTEKGLQIAPNLCIDESFRIYDIEMNQSGNIVFEYNTYWAYGGCESGSFYLTYDEITTGDFDDRIQKMLGEKQKNDLSERDKKIAEYNRKKKELEDMERELEI